MRLKTSNHNDRTNEAEKADALQHLMKPLCKYPRGEPDFIINVGKYLEGVLCVKKRLFTSKKLISLLLLLAMLISVIPSAAMGAGLDDVVLDGKLWDGAVKGDQFVNDGAEEDIELTAQKVDPSLFDLTGLRDLPTQGMSARSLESSSFGAAEFTEEELSYVEAYADMIADPVGIVDVEGDDDEVKYVFVWLQDLPEPLERIYEREGRRNQRYEEGRANARRARSDIRGRHNRGIVYEYSVVFSGFALEATVAELEAIAEMPGVFAITDMTYDTMDYIPDPEYTTPGNGGAREIMEIADLHAAGIDGTGVKVGVIDSGIDATHPDLQGSYAGGWNFAQRGTKNTGGRSANMSTPDGNHGTHVAGTIASQGITSLGVAPGVQIYMAQVFSPDNPNSAASADTTAALEAFSGGNPVGVYASQTLPKVDVVNLSMGNNYNSAYEAGHVARNNAVLAGVMVVNSAGNEAYPTNNTTDRRNYTVGSGGVSLPISVAASQHGGNPILTYSPVVSNTAGDSGNLNFFCENGDAALAGVFFNNAFGNTEPSTFTYGPLTTGADGTMFNYPRQTYTIQPLEYVDGLGYELYYACANNTPTAPGTTGSDMTDAELIALNNLPAGSLSGKILVVNRGQAFFDYKGQALRLGAGGLIVVNRTDEVIGNLNIGSETSAYDMLIFSAPSSFKYTLYGLVQGGETAYLAPGPLGKSPHAMEPAAFSSLGPVNETAEIKPDIIAPGWDILSLDLGGGYTSMSGTSMSSPWVAGVAALVKQQFPNATPAEIKARIMNTADPDVIKPLNERFNNPGNYFNAAGTEISVFEQGAGFVNPKRATDVNEVYITVTNYDVPTGATNKATFDEASMASFSFGPTMADTTSKTLTATVHGGVVDNIEVVYNHDTRYSNKNLDKAVEVFVDINGDTFDVWLEIGADANIDQVVGGNLYEGYLIVTVNGKDYVMPWATRVGPFKEPSSDYWLAYFDRPVQALRGAANQDFSPFSSQNLIFFMFEGQEIADSVDLRTSYSILTGTTYYLDLYLIQWDANGGGRLSHRISVNMGRVSGNNTSLKLSYFIEIGETYFVTWNGQANAITGNSVAGSVSNVPVGAYNIGVPFNGGNVDYYSVLGMVITNARPTIAVEDYTFTNGTMTTIEYACNEDEVTVNGRLYSAATQLAADMGFYWAGDYLWTYDMIFEVDQSLNVLVDAGSGLELEFPNPAFGGVEVPWFCDEEGYFSLTLPVNDDGYFFSDDLSPSGVVYCADAFDVTHPWQGSTVYMPMLYGAMASFQWLCLTEVADCEFEPTSTATCWTGGFVTSICALCGEVELDEDGELITYGWEDAKGHDFEVVKVTEPTCWEGGGTYVICNTCGHEEIQNWHGALGHSFGAPVDIEGNDLWQIVYCEREGCDHSEYVAKPPPAEVTIIGASNAQFISIAETAKNSKLWTLTFSAVVMFSDGSSDTRVYQIELSGNNANLDGSYNFGAGHDLAGYRLTYDIKGNGSNIKTFSLK